MSDTNTPSDPTPGPDHTRRFDFTAMSPSVLAEIRDMVGDVTITSGNGDVGVTALSGSADVSVGRGDVWTDDAEEGTADLRTGMGDVTVGVPAGTAARRPPIIASSSRVPAAWGTGTSTAQARPSALGDHRRERPARIRADHRQPSAGARSRTTDSMTWALSCTPIMLGTVSIRVSAAAIAVSSRSSSMRTSGSPM